ncbi:hypothetical protein B0H14DRAFT_2583102 [Mycena olivaceomarginata]|nr:hypothetical protein B0H14DRAFT_2583102 [Mycena olivaceomarginata]
MLFSSPGLLLFTILLLSVYCDGRRNGNALRYLWCRPAPLFSIASSPETQLFAACWLLASRQPATQDLRHVPVGAAVPADVFPENALESTATHFLIQVLLQWDRVLSNWTDLHRADVRPMRQLWTQLGNLFACGSLLRARRNML